MPHATASQAFRSQRRLITLIDLAGFAEGFKLRSDQEMAAFVDAYYHLATTHLAAAGGDVVKFIGDACLATFEPNTTHTVVETLLQLNDEVRVLAQAHGLDVRLGANLAVGDLVVGEFGPHQIQDIIGTAVNQTFRLGHGPGVRLNEAAYRSLPSGDRSGWLKRKPAVVYELRLEHQQTPRGTA